MNKRPREGSEEPTGCSCPQHSSGNEGSSSALLLHGVWYTGGFGGRQGRAMMESEYLKNHVKSLKPGVGVGAKKKKRRHIASSRPSWATL